MIALENANFNGEVVSLVVSKYTNGDTPQLRTWIYDDVMKQMIPHATLTANFPGLLKKGEVAIKEWGDNENLDVLAFLYAWDIADHPHEHIHTDRISNIPICKLKISIPK